MGTSMPVGSSKNSCLAGVRRGIFLKWRSVPPGTHIEQTVLDLSGRAQLPRRSVPVDLLENLHRFDASDLVVSGSTIAGAHACPRGP